MRVSEDMILRQVAGESILIPVGKMALSIHGMITLSESGGFLWGLLQKETDEAALLSAMLKEYEVDEVTAKRDLSDFLQKLRELGILLEA